MKKPYKKKKINIVAVGSILVCLCVFFLSVGFSAFQASLDISDISATIRVQKDIRVTGVEISNTTSDAYSNYEEYNVKNITSSVILPNSDSTITYQIEVTNVGNVMQGIYDIDEIYKVIGTDTNSNLEIKSKTVNTKEALCDDTDNTQCKLGSITTFTITIGYANNGYDSANTSHLVELDFDFRRVYEITYSGFSDTTGLPNQMIDGDTKIITFNNTTTIPSNVSVTGATGTYSSPNLTLSNITIDNVNDSIVITKQYSITYLGFSGNTSSLISSISASGGTIEFNSTTGLPSNVTVTGAIGNYNSITHVLTLSNVTENVTINAEYNGTILLSNKILNLVAGEDKSKYNHIITLSSPDNTCTNTLAYDSAGNLRYVGKNPCNYIYFNNESWRIIGITNESNPRVKIQRASSIGGYAWDSNGAGNNSGQGSNDWAIADLMKILNPGYDENQELNMYVNNSLYWNRESGKCAYDYYRTNGAQFKTCDFTANGEPGLLDNSKQYFSSTTWYLGSVNWNISKSNGTPAKWYEYERGIGTTANNVSDKYVGMIYQSDYGFGVGGDDSTRSTCLSTPLINWSSSCTSNNWLYHNKGELILARNSANNNYIYYIDAGGLIKDMVAGRGWDNYDIRPVLYLNYDVKYTGEGNGTSDKPYYISIN